MSGHGVWAGVKEDFLELTGAFCCCLIESEHFLRCMPKLLVAIQFLTLILQLVGTFEHHWIYTPDCNNMGLKSTCVIAHGQLNSTANTTELNKVLKLEHGDDLFGLQIASFSMNIICLIIAALTLWRVRVADKESKASIRTSCFTCVLPTLCMMSGFLNFIGCLVATSAGYSLGYSFYLCLSSAILLMIISIMSVTGYCCLRRNCCD